MGNVLKGISAAIALAAALATLDLYGELGVIKLMKRLYVEAVMTEAHYIGRARGLGLAVYALSSDGDWCGDEVVFKMVGAEPETAVSKSAAEFYMRRLGQEINQAGFCPGARSVEVYAYADDGALPLFWGASSAAVGWTEWDWERL